MTRWTIQVDEKTDRAVRTHIARNGGRKGDLSKFVEQAVKKAVFWQTVDDARAFNKDVDPQEIEAAVDAALDDVRAARP
jgi:predicted RNA-binding Zn ribbon-like protein